MLQCNYMYIIANMRMITTYLFITLGLHDTNRVPKLNLMHFGQNQNIFIYFYSHFYGCII